MEKEAVEMTDLEKAQTQSNKKQDARSGKFSKFLGFFQRGNFLSSDNIIFIAEVKERTMLLMFISSNCVCNLDSHSFVRLKKLKLKLEAICWLRLQNLGKTEFFLTTVKFFNLKLDIFYTL